MCKSADPLAQWLSISWERPERSYNPELRDFFVALLGYSKSRVVTEDRAAIGYPDLKLKTEEDITWIVGDLKKDDAELLNLTRREALWRDKRKYMDGLTRYIVFITPHYWLWVYLHCEDYKNRIGRRWRASIPCNADKPIATLFARGYT